jgi:hypothetical protein
MSSVKWVTTRIHDASQAILLSMVVIMGAWTIALLMPHAKTCGYPVPNNDILGLASGALTAVGIVSLNLRSLPLRAAILIGMSIATGLIACDYLASGHYTIDCVVYVILTLQSWWAIGTLPVKTIGRGPDVHD